MPLSDAAIRKAKAKPAPYKLTDGAGLHLLISPEGSRYWRLAYRFQGKQRTLALGVYPSTSLADARIAKDEAKRLLAAGTDPSRHKKDKKRAALLEASNTFEVVAREWLEKQSGAWTDRYLTLVTTRLESDVFPEIGKQAIVNIEAPDLLDLLRKVESRGALDIAKRLKQTAGQIFRFAIATGRAKRDPAADLKGALKSPGRSKHHSAISAKDLPQLLKNLEKYDGEEKTRLAIMLIILTFVRTSELRAAKWDEIDFEAKLWHIPEERMKMRRSHIVPLSKQAIEALKRLKTLSGISDRIFPSPSIEGYMSNNTMLFAMYRMGYHGRATIHGFRSVASTKLNEMGFNSDWIEKQLAHDDRNAVRAAYNRAQYLPERSRMMQHWADYIETLTANVSDQVAAQ